jgi:choline dehydrogenase-like flavoprotein
MEATFDYLVVGAGSAGCALAGRLADSGNDSIALLEAGGHDHHVLVRTPAAGAAFLPRAGSRNVGYRPFRRKGWTAGESASRVDAASAAHP